MPDAAEAARRLHAAHVALRADRDVQFAMLPEAPPAELPAWLKALGRLLRPIGRAFRWLASWLPDAPYAQALLWVVLALAVAAAGWTVWQRVRDGEWRLPRRRRVTAEQVAGVEEWAPDAAPARAWLNEADALAAAGRYAEAAHCLLIRSIEDLARRRPKLVRPALTARELSRADAVPVAARAPFAGIAALVERSLFGGRPVDIADWTAARAAYADFALPGAWRGASRA